MRRWMRSLGMWGDDNANTQGTLGPASTTSRPARSLRLFHGPQSRRLAAWRRCKQLGEHARVSADGPARGSSSSRWSASDSALYAFLAPFTSPDAAKQRISPRAASSSVGSRSKIAW